MARQLTGKPRYRPRLKLADARRTFDALMAHGSVTDAAKALGVAPDTIMAHSELVLAQAYADHWTHRHRGLLGLLPRACLAQSGLTPDQVRVLLGWGARHLVPGLGDKRAPLLLARLNRRAGEPGA